MKPLRPLKKGCAYMEERGKLFVTDFLPIPPSPWPIEIAPYYCFADAPAEEPVREGDRVVVNLCCVDPGTGAPSGDEVYAGRHGAVASMGLDTVAVKLDHSGLTRNFWDINLRHERDDERPAEVTISGDEAVAAMNPVIGCKLLRADGGSLVGFEGYRLFYPVGNLWIGDLDGMGIFVAVEGGLEAAVAESEAGDFVAAFECLESIHTWTSHGIQTFRRVRRLPEIPMDRLHPYLREEVEAWQAKHEPKPEPPPRKYEDGQWLRSPGGTVGIVTRADPTESLPRSWIYRLRLPDNSTVWYAECDLTPCPPPLSEAQRRLQPGDEVRVRKQRWDANGRPLPPSMLSGIVCVIQQSSKWNPPVILCRLTHPGEIVSESDEFLHNLDSAEEK